MDKLAAQYGITLDRALMRTDALYTFSELFNVSLCAENQFVNVVQAEINVATSSFHGQEEACIDTLSYCKNLLDEHADRMKECMALLDPERHTDWPAVTAERRIPVQSKIRDIRKDYEHLLQRCTTLADRAIHGSNFIQNYAMLLGSERAISQATEVGRLTLLAYLFLPLSFVTSFYGMNFLDFADWHDAVTSAVCVFVGVMLLSLVICFWDYMPWRRKERNLST